MHHRLELEQGQDQNQNQDWDYKQEGLIWISLLLWGDEPHKQQNCDCDPAVSSAAGVSLGISTITMIRTASATRITANISTTDAASTNASTSTATAASTATAELQNVQHLEGRPGRDSNRIPVEFETFHEHKWLDPNPDVEVLDGWGYTWSSTADGVEEKIWISGLCSRLEDECSLRTSETCCVVLKTCRDSNNRTAHSL